MKRAKRPEKKIFLFKKIKLHLLIEMKIFWKISEGKKKNVSQTTLIGNNIIEYLFLINLFFTNFSNYPKLLNEIIETCNIRYVSSIFGKISMFKQKEKWF